LNAELTGPFHRTQNLSAIDTVSARHRKGGAHRKRENLADVGGRLKILIVAGEAVRTALEEQFPS
jgi:hypothetical protein